MSRRMRVEVVVEADNQLRLIPQEHAAVAFRAGQMPLAVAGPPLSMPVHRVTPMAVLRQAMTLTPQVRRVIRPAGGTLDHDQLLAMPGGQPVQHRLHRPGHGQRRLPHTSTRGSLSSNATPALPRAARNCADDNRTGTAPPPTTPSPGLQLG